MKRVFWAFTALLAAIAIVGCNQTVHGGRVTGERVALTPSVGSTLSGEWKGNFTVTGNDTGTTYVDNAVTYVFRNDGKGAFVRDGAEMPLTWKIGAEVIHVKSPIWERKFVLSQEKGHHHLQAYWAATSLRGGYPQTHSVRLVKQRH